MCSMHSGGRLLKVVVVAVFVVVVAVALVNIIYRVCMW